MFEEATYRWRHGEKGVLGEKGAASALYVVTRLTGIGEMPTETPLLQLLRESVTAQQLVDETAEEFGIALSTDERVALESSLAGLCTVHEFMVAWKVLAQDRRDKQSPVEIPDGPLQREIEAVRGRGVTPRDDQSAKALPAVKAKRKR